MSHDNKVLTVALVCWVVAIGTLLPYEEEPTPPLQVPLTLSSTRERSTEPVPVYATPVGSGGGCFRRHNSQFVTSSFATPVFTTPVFTTPVYTPVFATHVYTRSVFAPPATKGRWHTVVRIR